MSFFFVGFLFGRMMDPVPALVCHIMYTVCVRPHVFLYGSLSTYESFLILSNNFCIFLSLSLHSSVRIIYHIYTESLKNTARHYG